MPDIVNRIADILIGDHIQLMNENAQLRERLESAIGQNANLIQQNKRLRGIEDVSESFHKIAVRERDYERQRVEVLEWDLQVAREALASLRADRDALRAEVERLREAANFAANAADGFRAEADALRAEVERLKEALKANTDACHDEVHRLADMTLAAQAERDALRAERDTLLLDARDFVQWFNRHHSDPSYNPEHPWCVINARLDAHADTLAAIDAARENKP